MHTGKQWIEREKCKLRMYLSSHFLFLPALSLYLESWFPKTEWRYCHTSIALQVLMDLSPLLKSDSQKPKATWTEILFSLTGHTAESSAVTQNPVLSTPCSCALLWDVLTPLHQGKWQAALKARPIPLLEHPPWPPGVPCVCCGTVSWACHTV